MFNSKSTPEQFNNWSKGKFPGLLGVEIISVEANKMVAEMEIQEKLFAPNGFLHAGSIVTMADTVAGYSTMAHLPEKAFSFTTLELKSNFMRAAREGVLIAESEPEHIGRTTQVWRVVVKAKTSGKTIAVFSCTQLILYK